MIPVRNQEAGDDEFFSTPGGLIGRIKKNLPENILADFIRDPDGLMSGPSSRLVKEGPKTKVVQYVFSDGKGRSLNAIIKRFRYDSALRRLGFFFFSSPATRCLKAARLLESQGVLTPEPLAAAEYRSWKNRGTSYFISEEVADGCSLQFFWQSVLAGLPTDRRLTVKRAVLRDLAQLLSGLHSVNIYHRDLKTSNILIQGWEGRERRVFLVDLDRVEVRRRLSLAKKVKNLLQVGRRAWPVRDKIYFFMRYAEGYDLAKEERKALVRKILALSRRRDLRRAP
jgi:hypothetical protein